jgi:hypothetical protein
MLVIKLHVFKSTCFMKLTLVFIVIYKMRIIIHTHTHTYYSFSHHIGVTSKVNFSFCVMGRLWQSGNTGPFLSKVKVNGTVYPRTGYEGMEGE